MDRRFLIFLDRGLSNVDYGKVYEVLGETDYFYIIEDNKGCVYSCPKENCELLDYVSERLMDLVDNDKI